MFGFSRPTSCTPPHTSHLELATPDQYRRTYGRLHALSEVPRSGGPETPSSSAARIVPTALIPRNHRSARSHREEGTHAAAPLPPYLTPSVRLRLRIYKD